MMVVGFFGCCGAIQESPCMLGLVIPYIIIFSNITLYYSDVISRELLTAVVFFPQFFSFLLVIFAVEVAAGIWGFSNQTKVGVPNAQCLRKHTD